MFRPRVQSIEWFDGKDKDWQEKVTDERLKQVTLKTFPNKAPFFKTNNISVKQNYSWIKPGFEARLKGRFRLMDVKRLSVMREKSFGSHWQIFTLVWSHSALKVKSLFLIIKNQVFLHLSQLTLKIICWSCIFSYFPYFKNRTEFIVSTIKCFIRENKQMWRYWADLGGARSAVCDRASELKFRRRGLDVKNRLGWTRHGNTHLFCGIFLKHRREEREERETCWKRRCREAILPRVTDPGLKPPRGPWVTESGLSRTFQKMWINDSGLNTWGGAASAAREKKSDSGSTAKDATSVFTLLKNIAVGKNSKPQ